MIFQVLKNALTLFQRWSSVLSELHRNGFGFVFSARVACSIERHEKRKKRRAKKI